MRTLIPPALVSQFSFVIFFWTFLIDDKGLLFGALSHICDWGAFWKLCSGVVGPNKQGV